MGSDTAKAVSTCVIWLATAVIMTFGLFRMNGDFLFFFLGMAIIAGAAAGATVAVWQRSQPRTPPSDENEIVTFDAFTGEPAVPVQVPTAFPIS